MASENVSVSLLELPDDVHLMILQFLGVGDLLACRLVCKRLGGLALHREAWRHQTLSSGDPHASAVLHLAPPCLKKVTVDERDLLPLVGTSCAIEHLTLKVTDKKQGCDATVAAEFALVVCRQEALGRLRHLDLVLLSSSQATTKADALMRTLLAASSSLKSLSLSGEVVLTTTRPVVHPVLHGHGPPGASLKRFSCPLTENTHSFVDAVLAGHATTLQFVDIGVGLDPENLGSRVIENDSNRSRLLASMPKLRDLTCRWSYGLEALAASKSLKDLSLYDIDDSIKYPPVVDGAAELLRRATKLRSVLIGLTEINEYNETGVDVVRLIDALAVPGRSLAELCVIGLYSVVLPPLCRALPALSQLTVLHLLLVDYWVVVADLDELLQVVSDSAPGLRLLQVDTPEYESLLDTDDECAHAWIHRGSVCTTLLANPSLHFVRSLQNTNQSVYCHEENDCGCCEACEMGCHKELVGAVVGLFSHDIDKCPAPDHHNVDPYPRGNKLIPMVWFQIQEV